MEVRLNMMHGQGCQSVTLRRALMLLVLGATAMQAEAAAMATLSMNGQTLSAEAGLKFEPERPISCASCRTGRALWGPDHDPRAEASPGWKRGGAASGAPRGEGRDFELGPLTAPPSYAFERGEVLRRGYRLRVELAAQGTARSSLEHLAGAGQQAAPARRVPGPPIPAGAERFLPGDEEWARFLPHRAVGEAILLRLSEKVLRDPDALIIQAGLAEGACVQALPRELRILGPAGRAVYARKVTLAPHAKPASYPVDRAPGRQELHHSPLPNHRRQDVERRSDDHVRRRTENPDAVAVSHLAPWTLRRDRAREVWETRDLRKACAEYAGGLLKGWQFDESEGQRTLICPPGATPDPVELRLPLGGYYAVFARATANGCLIQAGEEELVRMVRPGERSSSARRI